ncbi:hypothetical protein PIB30_050994 [Stylosanthes scabra]|uniref:Uncharacterized protein n=1 Tax=Stylosanthes scabra TaxID=79078 RepID=A0ABU6THJ8_9FABA|nr:hypothetical protein [Stylosanthes scabra]
MRTKEWNYACLEHEFLKILRFNSISLCAVRTHSSNLAEVCTHHDHHLQDLRTTPKFLDRELVRRCVRTPVLLQKMDRKRNQAALKGKKEVRAPPTRMSPRLAALRAPRSPPIKMRTPPSRVSPRLAVLKDSPLPLSPTSVLRPKKLLVLALAVPEPMPPPVTPVQTDPETPIPEIPRVPKMRRTARISVKPVWLQFPERVLAERRPSIATAKEKVVTNDCSDS